MKINPYLNFNGQAEEAFNFYKSVLGVEFLGDIYRMEGSPGMENLKEEEKNLVMHAALQVGDTLLMASDIVPSLGHKLELGNHIYLTLHVDSRAEADRVFQGLSEGGTAEMPMADMFWGDYYGCLKDKFGVGWMISYHEAKG